MIKRIMLLLTVVLVMVAMGLVQAVPAFAQVDPGDGGEVPSGPIVVTEKLPFEGAYQGASRYCNNVADYDPVRPSQIDVGAAFSCLLP